MNPEIISRVIKLIDKNNEKVILMDPDTGRGVVVMDLEAYEKLSSGKSLEIVEKKEEVKEISKIVELVEPQEIQIEDKIDEKVEEKVENKAEKPVMEETSFKRPYPPADNKKRPMDTPAFSDLTQSELLDKINRDIATWKTTQEQRREGELVTAAKEVVETKPKTDVLEEEERFYLEPVE